MWLFAERTKTRPLPSGRVTVFKAVVYLLAQYALGIALPLSYNRIAYVAFIHAFGKHIEHFSTLVSGLHSFNFFHCGHPFDFIGGERD